MINLTFDKDLLYYDGTMIATALDEDNNPYLLCLTLPDVGYLIFPTTNEIIADFEEGRTDLLTIIMNRDVCNTYLGWIHGDGGMIGEKGDKIVHMKELLASIPVQWLPEPGLHLGE